MIGPHQLGSPAAVAVLDAGVAGTRVAVEGRAHRAHVEDAHASELALQGLVGVGNHEQLHIVRHPLGNLLVRYAGGNGAAVSFRTLK